MNDQYHDEFYAWTREQAALLRAGDLSAADAANIAEEIEGMGHSLRDQLTNRLGVLLAHLLRWHYQPSRRGNSWRLTIRERRRLLAGTRVCATTWRKSLPKPMATPC